MNQSGMFTWLGNDMLSTFFDNSRIKIKGVDFNTTKGIDQVKLVERLRNSHAFGHISGPYSGLIKALRNIIEEISAPEIEYVSIFDIQGLSDSKSKGCEDLEWFAQNSIHRDELNSDRYQIKFETDDDFHWNINHIENYFKGTPPTLHIYEWNGKNLLHISGSSHHIGAIYRQCKEQNRKYSIRCHIVREQINRNSVYYMLQNYYSVILDTDSSLQVWTILNDRRIETYRWPLEDGIAVFSIPKKYSKSGKLFSLLLKKGGYDLDKYFGSLVI